MIFGNQVMASGVDQGSFLSAGQEGEGKVNTNRLSLSISP
jgi:hypothetical protein